MKFRLYHLLVFIISCSPLMAEDPFPSLTGWERTSEIQYYSQDNLWEYINGAADQFIDYNMQSLRMAEFSNGEVSVTVDIYDMEQPLQAFGIFANESRGISERKAIGAQAALSLPAQLLMFKDKHYVKVYAYEGKLDENSGSALLAMIAGALPGGSQPPAQIALLPRQNRKAGSEGYYRISYLGLSELKNCLYAVYTDEQGKEFQYFLTFPPDPANTAAYLNSLEPRWKKMTKDELTVYYRQIPYQGLTGLMITDQGILGTSHAADMDSLYARLKFFLNESF